MCSQRGPRRHRKVVRSSRFVVKIKHDVSLAPNVKVNAELATADTNKQRTRTMGWQHGLLGSIVGDSGLFFLTVALSRVAPLFLPRTYLRARPKHVTADGCKTTPQTSVLYRIYMYTPSALGAEPTCLSFFLLRHRKRAQPSPALPWVNLKRCLSCPFGTPPPCSRCAAPGQLGQLFNVRCRPGVKQPACRAKGSGSKALMQCLGGRRDLGRLWR